jgi:predicted nucleotidyltransferase
MARSKEDVIKSAVKFGEEVARLFDNVEVYLYGSYYKGTAKNESDIDLAVVSTDFVDMGYIVSLKILNKLRIPIDLDIEPIALLPEEISSPMLGSIASYIKKESILVYKSPVLF